MSDDRDPTRDRVEPAAEPADAVPAAEPADQAQPDQATAGQAKPAEPGPAASWAARFLYHLWSANIVTVTLLAVVLALLVGAVLLVISDADVRATYAYFFARPGDALSASWERISETYSTMFKGAIVDPAAVGRALDGSGDWAVVLRPISETLTATTPLVFTALAFSIAFRGGLFNIGGQGQAIIGAIGAALAGFLLPLPLGLHLVAVLLLGAAAGAVWGFVPGILKATTGAHEVITTIMLNSVALIFIGWVIGQSWAANPDRPDPISRPVENTARLPRLLAWLEPGLRVHLGIVVAVLAVAAMAWLLNRSSFGFELQAVGLNPDAARTAGMSVTTTYTLVMVLSGALGGLGGASIVLATTPYALTPQLIGNAGFDGILVGLLGRAKPWGVLAAALLFGALQAGGRRAQTGAEVSLELVYVIQALVVIFVAAPALVKATFRLRARRTGQLEGVAARGW